MVCRCGRDRSAVRRCDRAGGISESRREVKMSARLAIWRGRQSDWSDGHHTCRRDVTFSVFLPSRILASASLAPMPSVLPSSRISSTALLLRSSAMCGSTSSAVVSLRPLPSSEKTAGPDMACGRARVAIEGGSGRRSRQCRSVYALVGVFGGFSAGFTVCAAAGRECVATYWPKFWPSRRLLSG